MVRRKRLWIPIGLIVLGPLLALAWWLGSPLFLDATVQEEFPVVASAVGDNMASGEDGQATSRVSKPDDTMARADDATAESAATMTADDDTVAKADGDLARPDEPMGKTDEAMGKDDGAMAGEMADTTTPAAIKAGALRDADSFHKGSGQATIYRQPDGSYVLRLENLEVTNGPDLYVYLAGHADPVSRADIEGQGYVDLGRLKGNRGNQNYEIPAEVDLTRQNSVVIYCKAFHVVFSVAPLQEAG